MKIIRYYTDAIFYHYTDFKGRASRSEFWFFMLIDALLFATTLIMDTLVLDIPWVTDDPMILDYFTLTLSNVHWWATLLPSTAILTRRLHDVGQSGWLQLLFIIPWVGALIIDFVDEDNTILVVVFLLAAILGSIVLTVLNVIDSQKGSNRYGPNPKEKPVDDAPARPPAGAAQ
ncbi:MAG: DUF805 domain-containing protein [Burkholderiaceae bacterium]|nr:DUF805 domain-containing protein [Burkholderiaceae bacterium]